MKPATPLPWRINRIAATAVEADDWRGVASFGGYQDGTDEAFEANRQNTRFAVHACNNHHALLEAGEALIADVRRRYPGEELRCPYMIALDDACRKAKGDAS